MKNKIAIMVVVYPAAQECLSDFFGSLQVQTIKDFDICIVNDGLIGLKEWEKRYPSLSFLDLTVSNTAARNRQDGINWLVQLGYENVIFSDADDYYAPDRVNESIKWLQHYDIVVNDFDLVDEDSQIKQSAYLSARLKHGQCISYDQQLDTNCMGFGNTALRGSWLNKCVLNENVLSVDWYMFVRLLREGARAVFITTGKTYHRVYEGNMIGIGHLDEVMIKKLIKAKWLQYQEMAIVDSDLIKRAKAFEHLWQDIQEPEVFRKYVQRLQKLKSTNPMWFEEIQLMEAL